MPLPVAHGLLGAAVAGAISEQSRSLRWKPLLIGALLGICPDFDYGLNWLRVSGGGWHHGFTHSIVFAIAVGLITATVVGERKLRSVVVFGGATASHTLLDFMITESRGVALWWPFTDQRYKLRMPNPINYTWSDASLWEAVIDVLKISLTELLIFGPMLLVVILGRSLAQRRKGAKRCRVS
jgi:membrane-bound metal-dependent hydrolase YbcI (DUF457 family)